MELNEMEKKLLFQVEGDYQTKILNELYMTVRYSNNSEQREAAEGLMAKLRVLSNAECMDLVKDMIPDNMHLLPKDQPHRAAQTDPVKNTVTGHISMGTNTSSVFRKRHRRRNRQHKRKRVWIANRRKRPSWNLLRMNCRRRQRIKSSPMQEGRRNGLHKKQSRRKIVCRPGRNCAWRRFPTRRPEKPKNT